MFFEVINSLFSPSLLPSSFKRKHGTSLPPNMNHKAINGVFCRRLSCDFSICGFKATVTETSNGMFGHLKSPEELKFINILVSGIFHILWSRKIRSTADINILHQSKSSETENFNSLKKETQTAREKHHGIFIYFIRMSCWSLEGQLTKTCTFKFPWSLKASRIHDNRMT